MSKEIEQKIDGLSNTVNTLADSVENLTNATVRGFSEIHNKLREHDDRFTTIENNQDSLAGSVESLRIEAAAGFSLYKRLDERVTSLEAKVQELV